jgi:hypothetical protein
MTGSAITVTGRFWHSNQPSLVAKYTRKARSCRCSRATRSIKFLVRSKFILRSIGGKEQLRLARGQSPPRSLSCSYVPRQPSTGARQVRVKDQVLLDSLLVVLLPQRCRSLLFLEGFSDESDDLLLFRYVVELCDGEREG